MADIEAEAELREVCMKSMQLIVNTVPDAVCALWPNLLHNMLKLSIHTAPSEGDTDPRTDTSIDSLQCLSGCAVWVLRRLLADGDRIEGVDAASELNNGNASILVRVLALLYQCGCYHAALSTELRRSQQAALRRRVSKVMGCADNLVQITELLIEGQIIATWNCDADTAATSDDAHGSLKGALADLRVGLDAQANSNSARAAHEKHGASSAMASGNLTWEYCCDALASRIIETSIK